MQDVLERFETWAEQDHKEITLSGKDDISFNCDALWMSEAIGNIVKNALEHTQPGGHISVQWTQSPLLTQIVITDHLYNSRIQARQFEQCINDVLHSLNLSLRFFRKVRHRFGFSFMTVFL